MSNLTPVEREVLLYGLDDWIGLWVVIGSVEEGFRDLTDGEVREYVLRVVHALYEKGYVRLGCPTRQGEFVAWSESADEAITRIRHEWDDLGRTPTIGDICWLENTTTGDRAVDTGPDPQRP